MLPEDVVDKIAELDLELSEGDITQKGKPTNLRSPSENGTKVNCTVAGYEKKKNKLLAPFLKSAPKPTPSAPPSDQARSDGGGGVGAGVGGGGGGGGGGGDGEVRDVSEDGGGTTDSTRVSDSSGLNISVAGEPSDTR